MILERKTYYWIIDYYYSDTQVYFCWLQAQISIIFVSHQSQYRLQQILKILNYTKSFSNIFEYLQGKRSLNYCKKITLHVQKHYIQSFNLAYLKRIQLII